MNRASGLLVGMIFIPFIFACNPTSSMPAITPEPTRNTTALPGFVTANNGKFMFNGKPFYFVGTNFWQGMNLGVDGLNGNRDQLTAELDRLQRIGVTNLRVMASSEGPNMEPYRMVPALMESPGVYNEKCWTDSISSSRNLVNGI